MQLLLTLLRILGILILAVILLVLLVVSLVLLVPIRYQLWAKNQESLYAKVKIHWLLHLISLTAEYQEGLTYRLKILGITVFDEKKGMPSENENVDRRNKTDQGETLGQDSGAQQKAVESKKEPETAGKTVSEEKTKRLSDESERSQKKSFYEKIEDVLWKIIEFIQLIPEKIASVLEKWADFQENIGERVDSFLDKIDELNHKKDRLMRQIEDEQNRFAVKEIFRTLGKLLKHIRPRKLKVKGRLGFDDPAQTGQIFGIIGMLMPFYGEHIQLEAVFDEKVLEGELYLSGRIRLGSLLGMALRLVLRKEVRRLVKQFQKFKEN